MSTLHEEYKLIADPTKIKALNSVELMSYYLRSFQGRNDLSSALIHSNGVTSQYLELEKARNSIRSLNIKNAKSILRNLDLKSEMQSDILLEKMRVSFFEKNYEKVIFYSKDAKKLVSNGITLLTIHQVLARTYYELGDYQLAIAEMEKVIGLVELYPVSNASMAMCGLLALSYYQVSQFEKSALLIDKLNVILCEIEDSEIWIDRLATLLRTKFKIALMKNDIDLATTLLNEVNEVSLYIDKLTTHQMCSEDYVNYNLEKNNYSFYRFANWTYFSRIEFIFIHHPRKVIRINRNPLYNKILKILALGPISSEELFFKVWNLELSDYKKKGHLRSTLSSLRRFIPEGALKVEKGIVYLT